MKKYLLFLGLVVLTFSEATAQKVLLEQDVAKDSAVQIFGPNLKYFGHFYMGYGFIAGPSETKGSAIDYLPSHEFVFGYRFKYKVANFYALGMDAALTTQTFVLKQQAGKTVPTAMLFDDEKFKFTNFGLGVYNRFNWDKRGNYVGNFIDLGAYGNWMPFKAHIYQDDQLFGLNGPLDGVEKIKVREKGLKYVADFNYGVLARIGFNRYVFYGTYRLSDLFDSGYAVIDANGNNKFDFPELPRITVGFQISMHK